MDINKLLENITGCVNHYLANEAMYTDNVQLRIDPDTAEVEIADPEDSLPTFDYIPVMDLVRMSVSNPGLWEADTDAIDDLVGQYAVND